MTVAVAYQILGWLDMCAAFVMLWANQRITAIAGFHSPQARWALCRRFVYLSMAMALFLLGCKRFFGTNYDVIEACAQGVLLLGIMIFPLLRALGVITQDMLIDGIRTDRYRDGKQNGSPRAG